VTTTLERLFVYVANADSRELLVFTMNATSGELTLIEHVLGGKFTTLAYTPDQRFLFAGLRDEPFGIASFVINPLRGVLQQVGEVHVPGPLAYIETDRTGRWLLAASYHNNFVAISEIEASGNVREPHQVIGSLSKAHSIVAAPSNRFLTAASLGDDAVVTWPFDAATGRVSEQDAQLVKVSPGAGPRHIRFHPRVQRSYVLCELDATVRVFDYESTQARLQERAVASILGQDARGKPWAAELRMTPDGKFMYASERTSSTLTAFALSDPTGVPQPRGSVPTERQPRAFAIDPTGRFLLAVGERSNRLSTYAIDAETGVLTQLHEYVVGATPCWVEVLGF
jgi:6-phosphogluconolactonase